MTRKRKSNSSNKAERLTRKGLIKETLIVYACILFAILLLLLAVAEESKLGLFNFINLYRPAFVIPLIIYFLSIPLFCFMRKKDHLDIAYNKVVKDTSKEIVEKMLTPGKPTKINLIKTRNNEYNDFILKDLPKKADFYVVLGEDNLIAIYLRFRDDDTDIHFDVITKEEFLTYCKISE